MDNHPVTVTSARPRRCLVLGGAGFIGSHIVDALLLAGHQVKIFDRPDISLENLQGALSAVTVCSGDFANPVDIRNALEEVDVVFHLICTTLPRSSNDNPVYDVETNLVGNLHLLQAAVDTGVEKIIFASSGGTVYGVPETLPTAETHSTNPICSYGITKLAVEKYLAMFSHLYGITHTTLRLGNPYGIRQRLEGAQGAIAVFLGRIHQNRPVIIWGDGQVARDFVYVTDMARAFLLAMHPAADNATLNISSGCSLTLSSLLATMAKVTGVLPAVEYQPARKIDVPTTRLDITRAREILGWTPEVPLETGLQWTWKWICENY